MLDRLELASEFLCREPEQDRGRQVAIYSDPLLLGIGFGAFDGADALCLRGCLDLTGFGDTRRTAARIVSLLGNQQLLAPGKLGAVCEFIFGDRPFLFDGKRAALECRFVGLLLKRLEGRRLERAFKFARRREIGQSYAHRRDTDFGERRISSKRLGQLVTEQFRPSIQQNPDRSLRQILQHGLIGDAR